MQFHSCMFRGAHSRIRINNTEAYDEAIVSFLREKCPETYCN